jgi:hypothetical protein
MWTCAVPDLTLPPVLPGVMMTSGGCLTDE